MTPACPVPCVAGHGIVHDELRVDGLRVVVVDHAPGLTIDAHAHEMAKLAILLRGGASERIGLELVEHAPHEMVARPRFRRHENQYHACGARSLLVELEQLPDAVLAPPLARRHGEQIVAAFAAPRGERVRRVRAAVDAALAALRAARPPATPAWLERAREMLFEARTAPPPLAELARGVGVHPVHLAQAFRRRWNVTPRGYVRAHRVFEAVDQIARGVPLGRAAVETGFADQSHMTRAIQRARQAAPGALRDTMRAAAGRTGAGGSRVR